MREADIDVKRSNEGKMVDRERKAGKSEVDS
jgi:hypothetical protein